MVLLLWGAEYGKERGWYSSKRSNGGLRFKRIKMFGHSEKEAEMAFGRDFVLAR